MRWRIKSAMTDTPPFFSDISASLQPYPLKYNSQTWLKAETYQNKTHQGERRNIILLFTTDYKSQGMENTTDLKAFNQLFTDYQGRFIRFAHTYVRDMAVTKDFTIEALMYYWENRHSLEEDSNVPAYILTI